MTYTVIYVDENHQMKWNRKSSIEEAEAYGKSVSDNSYDICVSLYEYKKLQAEMDRMRNAFEQIANIAVRYQNGN